MRSSTGDSQPTPSQSQPTPATPVNKCNPEVESSQCSTNFGEWAGRKRKRSKDMVASRSSSRSASLEFMELYDPMSIACKQHRDYIVVLLDKIITGQDTSIGRPDQPETFWRQFATKIVTELQLPIEITDESVAACEKFGKHLCYLRSRMERARNSIVKLRCELDNQPMHLSAKLTRIFEGGNKLRFRNGNTGESSRSRSVNDNRLTDAGDSPRFDDWHIWEPKLSDALMRFLKKKEITLNDINFVSSYFRESPNHVALRCFLMLDDQTMLIKIQEILQMRPPM